MRVETKNFPEEKVQNETNLQRSLEFCDALHDLAIAQHRLAQSNLQADNETNVSIVHPTDQLCVHTW